MKIKTLTLLLSISVLISLFSCSEKSNNQSVDNNIQFGSVKLDSIARLISDSENPVCNIKLNLEYPIEANKKALLDTLNYVFVETVFGNQYTKLSFIDASKQYVSAYIADYQQLNKEFDKDELINSASFNYEEILEDTVYYNSNGFLCYGVKRYSYTGGAHGMSGTSCYAMELADFRFLNCDNIFEDIYIQNISDLIVAQIVKDRSLKTPSQLSEDGFFSVEEIAPTDNFYFNEQGITWIYNPYEIAVYAIGQIKVTLSWSSIKDYISESSPVYDFVKKL